MDASKITRAIRMAAEELGQIASPSIAKTTAKPVQQFPQLQERYPTVLPGKLSIDPKTGKEYLAKDLSDEAKDVAKARAIAQKEIKKGNFDPYFPPENRAPVDPKTYPAFGFDTTALIATRPDTFIKYQNIVNDPRAEQSLLQAILKGKENDETASGWYHMKQLQDKYIEIFGPEIGPYKFQKNFAESMAATTGGMSPTNNLMLAHYGNYNANKTPWPSNTPQELSLGAYDMPYPIAAGKMGLRNNADAFNKMILGEAGVTPDNPKRYDFAANFLGYDRAVMDDQMMSGGWGKFIPQLSGAPPQRMYGHFAQKVGDIGSDLGLSPSNAQELGWFGFKGLKNPNKDIVPQPMIQDVNEAIERTHRLTGMPHDEIVDRGLVRQEIPLYASGGSVEHALRLARHVYAEGGDVPIWSRRHLDEGGDAGGGGGGDNGGGGGDNGGGGDTGGGGGTGGDTGGDAGASSDAGNGNGAGAASGAAADAASGAAADAASSAAADAASSTSAAESANAAATAEAADAAAQAAAEASDVGNLGGSAATSAAGQAAASQSAANAAEAAAQADAEASDIGNLGSSAASSPAGQAAAAQSAANAAQAAQEDAEASDIGSLGISTVSPNTAAMLSGMAQSAIAGPVQGTQVAGLAPSPASVANSLAGLALGAFGPVGMAVGAVNSLSGMLGGPNLGSSLGLSSQGFGTSTTTARDSNTTDATGVTGGNAGNGPSAADLGAGFGSGLGYGNDNIGGGGGGGDNVQGSGDEGPAKPVAPVEKPKPVAPIYTAQNMPYGDFGAAKSVENLSKNLYNFDLPFTSTGYPTFGGYKKGGAVTQNNAVGNALKLAMIVRQEMHNDPLFERKIRSILSKL